MRASPLIPSIEAWQRFLDNIRSLRTCSQRKERLFISWAGPPADDADGAHAALESWLAILRRDLERAGFRVALDFGGSRGCSKDKVAAEIAACDAALIVGTPRYMDMMSDADSRVAHEVQCIQREASERAMAVVLLVAEGAADVLLRLALVVDSLDTVVHDMRDRAQYVAQLTKLGPMGVLPVLLGLQDGGDGDDDYRVCVEAYQAEALTLLPPRNPQFCGREDLLVQLATALHGDISAATTSDAASTDIDKSVGAARVAVVSGAGGTGKAQVMLEYAHRHRRAYRLVRWLAAEGAALRESMERLAEDMGIPSAQVTMLTTRQLAAAVVDGLRGLEPWLIVLCGCDGPGAASEVLPPQGDMRGGQHFVVTSRSQSWPGWRQLSVGCFNEVETIALFQHRIFNGGAEDHAAWKEIAERLDRLPLAISHAAAYMGQTGQDAESYLRELEQAAMTGGTSEMQTAGADDHPRAARTTLAIAMEHLRHTAPAAWRLLQLCAYLGPDTIPLKLLAHLLEGGQSAEEVGGATRTAGAVDASMDAAVTTLRDYALLEWDRSAGLASVHRMVQGATRLAVPVTGLTASKVREELLHTIVIAIAAAHASNVQRAEVDDVRWMRAQVMHMEATAAHLWELCSQRSGLALPTPASDFVCVAVRLASAYVERGDVQRHKKLLERVLAVKQRHFGSDHHACILGSLGTAAHGGLRDIQRRKELLEEALEAQEKRHGAGHSRVALTLVNLANVHGALGDVQQKRALLERALSIEEEHYGPDHGEVASTLVCLGNAYGDLGQVERQVQLLGRALALHESRHGPSHYQVASTLVSLGKACDALDDVQRQRELLERALGIEEGHYGADHCRVASTLAHLADAHSRLGDVQRQRELLERALAIQERHYGAGYYGLAMTLLNIGDAHKKAGDAQRRREALERALAIEEQFYGPHHYQAAITLVLLADAHTALNDLKTAAGLLRRAVASTALHHHEGQDAVWDARLHEEQRDGDGEAMGEPRKRARTL